MTSGYYGHEAPEMVLTNAGDTIHAEPLALFALIVNILLANLIKPEHSNISTLTWLVTSSIISMSNFTPFMESSRNIFFHMRVLFFEIFGQFVLECPRSHHLPVSCGCWVCWVTLTTYQCPVAAGSAGSPSPPTTVLWLLGLLSHPHHLPPSCGCWVCWVTLTTYQCPVAAGSAPLDAVWPTLQAAASEAPQTGGTRMSAAAAAVQREQGMSGLLATTVNII